MSKTKAVTNAMLKDILTDTMVDRGFASNIDGVLTQGVYKLNGSEQGTFPTDPNAKYSILEVFVRGSVVYQRLTSKIGAMAVRVKGDSWSKWRIFTGIEDTQ